jgi:hypothetical protein
MTKKKLLGWGIMITAVLILVVGDSIPSIMSLFATLSAMFIGGIGMYLAFGESGDAQEKNS